jgi:RNA polymerase sigma-70 factor (ECF subfamily)
MEPEAEREALAPEVLEHLVASHREFLAFLERRVESRAAAEEILQSAFVRTLERGGSLRAEESAVAWFYRLLRNAVVDHYRRRGRAPRTQELDEADAIEVPALRDAVCRCVERLLPTLRPEYAEMLRAVDLDEAPIASVAARLSITPNNATVRLHRARRALKQQLERSCGTCATHGCLDCSCGAPGGSATA